MLACTHTTQCTVGAREREGERERERETHILSAGSPPSEEHGPNDGADTRALTPLMK